MAIVEGLTYRLKWTGHTREHYESKGYKFTAYSEEFDVRVEDLTKGSSVKVKCECDFCENEFSKRYSYISNQEKIYCSLKCSYEDKKCQMTKKNCLMCNKDFWVKPSGMNRILCSTTCQAKWQSSTLVGENANNYNKGITEDDRMISCEQCGENFRARSPYVLKQVKEESRKHFCSMKCKKKWYAEVWSQTDEWREESRKRAVSNLESGVVSKTESAAQIRLNEILDDIRIEYVNEYNCTYVSIDNYLIHHHLMIEVMGSYWHVDPRFYNHIKYQAQYDRVVHDKRKRELIKNNYNINILYLWEDDILNNPSLCKNLIYHYISNNGIIEASDSFNYTMDENDTLVCDNKITPYMDLDIDEIKQLFIPADGKKKSYKQVDKWITFNCDQCGNETEQLISRYKKAKSHFCSYDCKNISQKK